MTELHPGWEPVRDPAHRPLVQGLSTLIDHYDGVVSVQLRLTAVLVLYRRPSAATVDGHLRLAVGEPAHEGPMVYLDESAFAAVAADAPGALLANLPSLVKSTLDAQLGHASYAWRRP